ncbi:MAG TPA: hypothetical protein VJ757_00515 [Pseudonocardiaceae bacterium]|nr:hypothetical protein [Pseudonocardiaceae bacterium]
MTFSVAELAQLALIYLPLALGVVIIGWGVIDVLRRECFKVDTIIKKTFEQPSTDDEQP